MFSSGDGGWDVVDKHALPGVDGHVRDRPHTVDFLKPRSSQPTRPASGRELTCAGVFAYQRDEHIHGHGMAALFLDYGSEDWTAEQRISCIPNTIIPMPSASVSRVMNPTQAVGRH